MLAPLPLPMPVVPSTATLPELERDAEPEGPCATPREDVTPSELADHPSPKNMVTLAERTRSVTEKEAVSPNLQRSKLFRCQQLQILEKEEKLYRPLSFFFF